MGLIHAEIELVNPIDLALHQMGQLAKEDIKTETVTALVDTGAYMLCINEHLKHQLDIPIVSKMEAELADGSIQVVDVAGPITVNFKNRTTNCNAAVLPGETEVLLGAIPMEDLDVVLNPKQQTIEVNPNSPYLAKKKLK